MKLNIEEVRTKIIELAAKIQAPMGLLPQFERDNGEGYVVQNDASGIYIYKLLERGQACKELFTEDINELLFWIFDDITFSMALDLQKGKHIMNQDPRRSLFKNQEELLAMLNEGWKQKREESNLRILKLHPFDDFSETRSDYIKELTDQGFSSTVAREMGYKKYPPPDK